MNYLLNTSSVLSCFEMCVYSKPRVCWVLVDWWWSVCLWLVTRRCGEAWSLTDRGWILYFYLPSLPIIRTRWYFWVLVIVVQPGEKIQGWDIFLRAVSCLGQRLLSWGEAVPSSEGSRCRVAKPRLVRTRRITAGCSLSQAGEFSVLLPCCSQGGMRDWKIPSCSLSFLEKVALAFCNTWISVYLQKIFSSTVTETF